MNKLNSIIALLSLNDEGRFLSDSEFVIKKEGFTVYFSEDENSDIAAKAVFDKKIHKDLFSRYAEKLCESNGLNLIAGFAISSNGTISKSARFSGLIDDRNIAFALTVFFDDLYVYSVI